jgi:RsiW-degrading membrane proteinase PrsW (M82 family)
MFPNIYMIFLAGAALVSVSMWLDYFRRIDVFEREKLPPLIVALCIGGFTPYLCLYNYGLLAEIGFTEKEEFFNDLLFAIFGVGLNEELCKLAGVFIVFKLLKRQLNEPIDYLIYAGVTALGFALVENYYYFARHGIRIITSRTFYSALEHIINTSIIVYGFYRTSIFKKGNPVVNTMVALAIAVSSHGLFDFFLTENVVGPFAVIFSLMIYLIGINFWIQMLNNANNYSGFFDYDKIIFSRGLAYRLSAWYIATLVIAFVNNTIAIDLQFSLITLLYGILSDGFLFFIVILRVSRFKILREKYLKVTIGFPFYFTKNEDADFRIPFLNMPVKIRGENYREHLPTRYINRQVSLIPVDPSKSFIKKEVTVTIADKLLLTNDVVVYEIAPVLNEIDTGSRYFLKPSPGGVRDITSIRPVEALYKLAANKPAGMTIKSPADLEFLEWVYLQVQR